MRLHPERESSTVGSEVDTGLGAALEVAEFNDGFRAVRDGKSPDKGTLFFTPAEWEASPLLTPKARREYERRQTAKA